MLIGKSTSNELSHYFFCIHERRKDVLVLTGQAKPTGWRHHQLWEWPGEFPPGEFPAEPKEAPGPGWGGACGWRRWLKARRWRLGEGPGSPPRTDEAQTPTEPLDRTVSCALREAIERREHSSNRMQFVL